jgi:hypothetical protein
MAALADVDAEDRAAGDIAHVAADGETLEFSTAAELGLAENPMPEGETLQADGPSGGATYLSFLSRRLCGRSRHRGRCRVRGFGGPIGQHADIHTRGEFVAALSADRVLVGCYHMGERYQSDR